MTVEVLVEDDAVKVGDRFAISFQRTLRVPESPGPHPLPPSLGRFPLQMTDALDDQVPPSWRGWPAVVIPMHQREALWLAFDGDARTPRAVKVGVGGICAVSGSPWNEELHDDVQDYVVCPPQPWLDGLNAGSGEVRQFVAAPLGTGRTVEAQLTGSDSVGGMQIVVYGPADGRFPPPPVEDEDDDETPSLGIAPGGHIAQKIYPDPYGVATWEESGATAIFVHLLNTEQYRDLTGLDPPPTPVDAEAYIRNGLPWFELYDEDRADVAPSARLATMKGLREVEREQGEVVDDELVGIPADQIRHIEIGPPGPSGEGRT